MRKLPPKQLPPASLKKSSRNTTRIPHRKAKSVALAVVVIGAVAAIVIVCVIGMQAPPKAKPKVIKSGAKKASSHAKKIEEGLSQKSGLHGASLTVLSKATKSHTVELAMEDMKKAHEFHTDSVQSMHEAKVCVKGRSISITLPIDIGTAPTGTLHLQGMVDVNNGEVIHLGACEVGEPYDPPLKFGSTPGDDALTIVAWNEENKLNGYKKEKIGVSVPDLLKTKLIKGDTLRIEGNDYSVFAIGEGDASRHNGKYVMIQPKLGATVMEGAIVTRVVPGA
tara:strand:- start:1676 stop:2515 length:840 start_codon:yes stop_codon:yes gene_type:complete